MSRRWPAQRCVQGADGQHAPDTYPCHAERQQRLLSGRRRQRTLRSEDMEISSKVGTMGRGKGQLNVSTCPLTAHHGNTNGSVKGLRLGNVARAGRDAAESLLLVVVPTQAAATEAIAAHGVVDIAALDATTTKASGGDVRVGSSCTKAQVATVDEVAVGGAEIQGDRDGVQMSPCMPALETEQAHTMRQGVVGSEEFCSRTLI
jgi:hypothetical protein